MLLLLPQPLFLLYLVLRAALAYTVGSADDLAAAACLPLLLLVLLLLTVTVPLTKDA